MRTRFIPENELVVLLNASDSEEEVSEEENHTSDDSFQRTSESDSYTSDSDIERYNVQSEDKKITWSEKPFPQHGRASCANILKSTPGPTRYAICRVDNVRSSFEIILNTNLKDIVLKMSNIEGRRVYGDNWEDLDIITFDAYISILLLAGVYRSRGESTKSLWNSETGRPIFSATMPLKTFHCISRVLRFDDKSDRRARRADDKLAAIRDFWEQWVMGLTAASAIQDIISSVREKN
ncbi:hypothetical protein J437_LFUL011963 [Ladona fulva]|uniref:PiggyBac transposable element-derived protein domain-containing protein n=1 Tax=Ladona fulva TaxID=123851 RepID=A0A8K0P630_LADFU|nr:hypothetical protein J437_LFUL011963 [Ladona fulva]